MGKQSLNQSAEELNRLPEDTLGQRIRKLRLNARLKQKQLAALLGFTSNYLGQVERDAKPLSKNMADAICNYFHVDYNYLYHGIRLPQPEEHGRVQENAVYGHDPRTLLGNYIRNCSEDECRMLKPVIESLLYSLREAGWFDQREDGQIKDES